MKSNYTQKGLIAEPTLNKILKCFVQSWRFISLFFWKLVWSGGSYHTRISVALFTLLRSHSPHSARRQMSPENLANMPEMRFVIASRLWPHRHTNSRSREVCGVCLCVCVTICFSVLPPVLSAHIRPDKFGIFSKCFYDVNPASSAMCESFC